MAIKTAAREERRSRLCLARSILRQSEDLLRGREEDRLFCRFSAQGPAPDGGQRA